MHTYPTGRQPSNGPVLRTLHSQISSTAVDYSPWMRQQRPPLKSAGTTATTTTGGVHLPGQCFYFLFQIKLEDILLFQLYTGKENVQVVVDIYEKSLVLNGTRQKIQQKFNG